MHVPAMRVNGVRMGGPSIFGLMLWFLFLRFIVPMLGIFYGTSLIADEVEDKTITYLFTRPIPRSAVLIGKYLAYLASTVLIVLPSVMLVYFLVVPIGGGGIAATFPDPAARPGPAGHRAWRSTARCLRPWAPGSSARSWLAFSSPSAGRTSPWPCPGYLKRFTVAFYTQGLVPARHAPGQPDFACSSRSSRKPSRRWQAWPDPGRRHWGCRWLAGHAGRGTPGIRAGAIGWGEFRNPSANSAAYTSLEDRTRMTKRTRYFMFGSVTVLLVGLCTGLVAYYTGMPMGAFGQPSGPAELRYVPARRHAGGLRRRADVMQSEFRQKLRAAIDRRRGRAGGVPEGDRHRHRARHRPRRGVHRARSAGAESYTGMVIATGRFDPARLEALAREHERPGRGLQGQASAHRRGDRTTTRSRTQSMTVAFLEPGVVARRRDRRRQARRSIARAARASSTTTR